MTTRRRHEFLEDSGSDEDLDDGYDSEAKEQSRTDAVARAPKRRKLDARSEHSIGSAEDSDDGDLEPPGEAGTLTVGSDRPRKNIPSGAHSANDDARETTPPFNPSEPTRQSAAAKEAAAAAKAVHKSGVVYLSRVPPFMKPHTLKHFLAPHAPRKGLGRVFLTPEDRAAHLRRVQRGGNKKKSFVDGWVEFGSKAEAQRAAASLNGNIIGGKKRNFYHDDLWNIKYLKGFKWHHLTEQIANENAARAARLTEEVRRTRKENKAFLEDVERAKMVKGIESQKKAKMGKAGTDDGPDGDIQRQKKPPREFKQRKARVKETQDDVGEPSAQLTRVLGKIF